jgi:hypothetical protein
LLQTTSEKALRKQLQQFFKTDMGEKKAFIKEQVSIVSGGDLLVATNSTLSDLPCCTSPHCTTVACVSAAADHFTANLPAG